MSALEEPFEPSKEEGTPPITLLPAGKYRAEVIDASVSKSKNQQATLLNLTWEITQEGVKGRVYQQIITRHSSSPDAERFGRYMLKDLCVACGITEAVTEVGVFYWRPCIITVKIEHDREGVYADKNRVTRILPVTATAAPGPVTSKADANGPDTSTKIDTSMPPSNTGPADVPYSDDIPF